MTVLLSVAVAPYPPGTQSFPFTVPNGSVEVTATMTRVGWPAGVVANVAVVWADGSRADLSFEGGLDLNRKGVAISAVGVGIPLGVTQGNVTAQMLQPITTAIVIASA